MSKLPTEPGFYWATAGDHVGTEPRRRVVEVFRAGGTLIVLSCRGVNASLSDFTDYAGPLVDPVSPGDCQPKYAIEINLDGCSWELRNELEQRAIREGFGVKVNGLVWNCQCDNCLSTRAAMFKLIDRSGSRASSPT